MTVTWRLAGGHLQLHCGPAGRVGAVHTCCRARGHRPSRQPCLLLYLSQARLALETSGGYISSRETRALDALRSATHAAGIPPDGPFDASLMAALDAEQDAAVGASLMELCALYLVHAKQRQNALDPVIHASVTFT